MATIKERGGLLKILVGEVKIKYGVKTSRL
jgi:hypothetical protein